MKTFEVELRRTSYVVITVEAESQEDAETKAWKELDNNYEHCICCDELKADIKRS